MVQIHELPAAGRLARRPAHTFQLRHKPFIIQPFMIAPVLPGETMKNLLLQARAVTDPIKNPLIGWWLEYYVFYVKHRDLDGRDDFSSMMLTQGYDLSAYARAADVDTYHAGNGLDWTQLCLQRVVDTYFRDEGDAWNDFLIDGMPIASINSNSWVDSLTDTTVLGEGTAITGTEDQEALDLMARQYEHMRAMQLTNMSYEDFLATYGIKGAAAEEPHRPELVRYLREWQYPSNTIDPSDGSPSSAVSWAISERADKARFFKEPGFVFGVTVARPKVYFSKQVGAGVSMMQDALSWLPAIMKDDVYTSLKEFTTGVGTSNGPLHENPTNGYWVDVRDLLLYGDQFINFALTETDAGFVALPTAALEARYPDDTSIKGLFTDTVGTAIHCKQDGICSLNIMGTQMDHT